MMALGVRPTLRRFFLELRCVLLGHAKCRHLPSLRPPLGGLTLAG